jgi:hypothetical protein
MNPDLFPIVTPVHGNDFCSVLSSHPNHALVKSVCDGLEKGFWPYADLSALDPNLFFDHDTSARRT